MSRANRRRSRSLAVTVVVGVSVLALGGCAWETKEFQGRVAGAGVGAVAGSFLGGGLGNILFITGGALAGGYVGGVVGRALDNAGADAPPPGASLGLGTGWTVATPEPHGSVSAGSDGECREIEKDVAVGGLFYTVPARACRLADGGWRLVR